MICEICGQEYSRKPRDTRSKVCVRCRPVAHRKYSARKQQLRKIRELAQVKFHVEWAAWLRDFELGKTQSNLEMMN